LFWNLKTVILKVLQMRDKTRVKRTVVWVVVGMKQIAFRIRFQGKVSATFVLALFGLLAIVITVTSFTARTQAAAGIYKTINFQGKVVNTNGTNVPDASYTFKFRIYTSASGDTATPCANTCAWEESKSLTTVNGIFQTNLGDTTTLPGSVNFNTDSLYIGVIFNGDTEMTPRIRLTAVPYAFNADMLDGLDSSALVQLSPASQQTGSINISGGLTSGGTVAANTFDAASSGALVLGSTNATGLTLAKNTTLGSGLTLSLQGSSALSLGSTSAAGGIIFKDGTANNRSVTLVAPALTGSYSLNLPATAPASGTLCLQTASGSTTNLAFGACGVTGSFVTLQAGTPGTADTGNLNISGVGIAASFYASTFDRATGGLLNLGTSTASSITIGRTVVATTIGGTLNTQDVSVAADKTITFATGAGNFDQSLSNGTFKTGVGAVSLNGNTTIASGKSLTVNGQTFLQPASDILASPTLNIKTSLGNNVLTVAASSTLTQMGLGLGSTTLPALTGSGLQIQGALRLSGGAGSGSVYTDTFITPVGTSVQTKINIPTYDPGNFGQVLALGLPSSAFSTARVISLFDARSVSHQPTIGVFSPDENNLVGFSWEGSNSISYLKTTGTSVAVRSNTTDIASFTTSGIGFSQNLTFDTGATRTIQVGGAAGAGNDLSLKGGAAGGTNTNGGNLLLSGGAGIGTGVKGLVMLDTPTFTTSINTACGSNCTITQANIDNSSAVLVTASVTNLVVTMPDPINMTAGRIVYVTAANGSNDFTLSINSGGVGNQIAMRQNTSATMVWNGTDWTAAGASSSTTLQAAYDNTLASAGGAEILLNNTASSNGLTIRNSSTNPIIGPVFEVQSSIGTNLLSVNNSSVEYAKNGGTEASGTFSSDWSAIGVGSVSRNTNLTYVATGQASGQIDTPATINTGVKIGLTANLAVSTTYQVSMTGKMPSGTMSGLEVRYSRDGTNTVACGTYSTQTLVATGWSKITCTFTTDATTATSPYLFIRQTDAVARTFYIDNVSVTLSTISSTPPNLQVGGGIYGGPTTLFTLDRASSPPVASGNDVYYGSMYYDTTSGRIQCYQANGWGACGSAPDSFINLVPEYSGAVLNGTGIGTLTADFCANQSAVLAINTSLCSTGQALNFYKWTSPQATTQTYSIYVTYQLPGGFKQFQSDSTVQLTARVDNTTNAAVTYEMFRSEAGAVSACGTETTVTTTANTWQTVGINGNENSGCGFSTSTANNFAIFKINVKAKSNANVYVSTLSFTVSNQ
jgi:hypothetical protein